MSVKSIKIKDLIKALETVLQEKGNVPVVMSCDEEGNGFGTISAEDPITDCMSFYRDLLILYPWSERNELDDIEGVGPYPDEYYEE